MKLEGAAFDPLRSPTLRAITPDVFGSGKVGDWYGMITGRLGYAWDRTLFYVKGGAAFVQVRGSVVDNCQTAATGCGNWVITTPRHQRHDYDLGHLAAGIERAVFNNWSIKAEYMFIGLGDSHSSEHQMWLRELLPGVPSSEAASFASITSLLASIPQRLA